MSDTLTPGLVEHIERYCQQSVFTLVQGEVFEWVMSITQEVIPHNAFDQFTLNEICRKAKSEYRVLYTSHVLDDSVLHSPTGLYVICHKNILNAVLDGFIVGTDDSFTEVCKRLQTLAYGQTQASLLQDARR